MTKARSIPTKEALEALKRGDPIDLLSLEMSENEEENEERKEEKEEEKEKANGVDDLLSDVPQLAELIKEYPELTDIPKEVEQGIKAGKSPLNAYREYENQKLKEKLRAYEQNAKNGKSSIGSLGGDSVSDEDIDGLLRIFGSVFN